MVSERSKGKKSQHQEIKPCLSGLELDGPARFYVASECSDTQQASHSGSQPDQAQGAQPLHPLSIECQVERIADRTEKYLEPAKKYF